ncbi:MAG TPA: c-type cytochrome, partial [Polyangia bacterium]|nr:c-type cytochrome [Polyangia bacterium]
MVLSVAALWGCTAQMPGQSSGTGGSGRPGGLAGSGGGGGAPGDPGSGGMNAGGATGGGGMAGAAGGLGGMPGPCVATGGDAPSLPPSFVPLCSSCHSAFGASANPAVPNLFASAAGAAGTSAAFLSQVRNPQGGTLMPAFPASTISDGDVQRIFAYFKAGASAEATTCPGSDGTSSANLGACSGQALSFAPLFVADQTPAKPISYVDPVTKHIIFRGAGRVRFRHEMEDTFAIYHDHYFENRTFEYILDDSIPAGGTT